MLVGIVGGAERSYPQYRRIAAQAGHDVELHPGHMSSCGASSLEALVRRCDLLVIATDVNSHAAVKAAKELSRSHGVATMLCRRLGMGRFTSLLAELDAGEAFTAAAR